MVLVEPPSGMGDHYKHEDRGGKNTFLACWSSKNSCLSSHQFSQTGSSEEVLAQIYMCLISSDRLCGAYNILCMLHFIQKASLLSFFLQHVTFKPREKSK